MNNSIIPGILEKEWSEIEKKIIQILPVTQNIHIDIIDGKFAPSATFLDPAPFAKYARQAYFELHMMVDEPVNFLKPWAEAGFKRFLGHVEKMSDQAEFVAQAQLLGEAGLAVDAPTALDAITVPLSDLDVLLFMTVKTGSSGQQFDSKCLEKLEKIKELHIPIEVDGGINEDTIHLAREKGATRFVSTSFIFYSQMPREQYIKLNNKLKFKRG
ncbi:MAG: hypothetical protein HYT08_03410 [Candidatus Levybacteria bacterium]|nr:hypothetical protein [Candidatus Levybacteria bacterium]